MRPNAIVYTSGTGHTAAYAALLGEKTGLPVMTLTEASDRLSPKAPILYLGWLMGGSIQGYRKAEARYQICAVCAVGLCETGTLLEGLRHKNEIPHSIPFFTLQGGLDFTKLPLMHKLMLKMLIRALRKRKHPTAGDTRMLDLLLEGGNFVSEANLREVLTWFRRGV